MTSAKSIAAALVARGLDEAEEDAKAAMFERVLHAFASKCGGEPEHARWVPGRLEVFGKHTDYAGGRTLVCAVPRGFAMVARPRSDGQLHVIDAKRDETFIFHPWDADTHAGWRHYVEVVARRLGRNFPGSTLGADVVLESDLPRASGMSSSSALVVGVAATLVRAGGLDRRSEWRTNIATPLDLASYFGCLENGMPFGSLAGDAGVGTHGGSEDHAAIVNGAAASVSAFRFVPMRRLDEVRIPAGWRFVLSTSGIAARKTGAAMHQYNRLSQGTRLLLELWNASQSAADSLAAITASPANVARLRELIGAGAIAGWPRAALGRRLDHFIREDARVPIAADALRTTDAEGMALLARDSQEDAELLLGNQIPETIALVHAARASGAFAACSFGAGFGGSVWALTEGRQAQHLARQWHPGAFVAVPGPPATEL
jgi:galactokinase